MTQQEAIDKMIYVCGFAAVNNGKHCVPDGLDHCVVCHKKVLTTLKKFDTINLLSKEGTRL